MGEWVTVCSQGVERKEVLKMIEVNRVCDLCGAHVTDEYYTATLVKWLKGAGVPPEEAKEKDICYKCADDAEPVSKKMEKLKKK